MASEVPITSNARAFEECSQLVNLIRYQLGDPTELLNNFCFRNGSAFALVDRRQIQCDDDQSYYRHTANFAWVLLETFFTGGVPEMRSPIFVPNGCYRRWQFVANYIRGGETIPDEVDVHLQCLDCRGGRQVRADVRMDLHRGTDKIGGDATSHVYFDEMVQRHVVFTGARRRTPADDSPGDGFADAYTVQGSFSFKDCCDEKMRQGMDLDPDFQTSFYA